MRSAMHKATLLQVVLGLGGLLSCASQTRLPAPVRERIQSRHAESIVALKSSHYYGDFYGENEHWLLSPYAFKDTSDLVDTRGRPIYPRGERGVVPAGSVFRIKTIEFPDMRAMATRMLMTPRFNPWVILEPLNNPLLESRRSTIVVLPRNIKSEEGVEKALKLRFGPEEEVHTWLKARNPRVRLAIKYKEIEPEMTQDELVASWGIPKRWIYEDGRKVAWYGSREVWLRHEKIVKDMPGRTLTGEAPPAQEH